MKSTLSFFAVLALSVFIPLSSAQSLPCQGLTPTIIGTEGDDMLVGTDGDDVIAGLGGIT
jgi:hypothetical protein